MNQKRRWTADAEACARRANAVLDLTLAGKSKAEIMQETGLAKQAVGGLKLVARDGLNKSRPFVPKGRYLSKQDLQRAQCLISHSIKLIQGKIPRRIKDAPRRKTTILKRRLISLIAANPSVPAAQLANKAGVSQGYPRKIRKMLENQGKIVPLSASEADKIIKRKPEKQTGVLSKEKIKSIIVSHAADLNREVRFLFARERWAFDLVNLTEGQIIEEIAERLGWSLGTFDPSRQKIGTENQKLERFFRMKLSTAKFDIRRQAIRRASKIRAGYLFQGEKGKTLADELPAKKETPEFTVAEIEEACDEMGLDIIERAVFFGLVAGVSQVRIGRALGYTKPNISAIRKAIAKKGSRFL